MIYIYVQGHDFRYGVYELVRMFFFGEEIIFIEDLDEYDNEGMLIENYLLELENSFSSVTKVFKNEELFNECEVKSLENINIAINNLRKKLNLGVKQSIYKALNSFKIAKVPWGILIGVRPIKVVEELIYKGIDDENILNILQNEYKLLEEKAKLMLEIGNVQRKYLYPISEEKYSLYVSIPFCPTRCVYCSFPSNSIKRTEKYVDEYTEKIIYEMKRVKEIMGNKKINTVYIGGGTPTAIPVRNLEKIIENIYLIFGKENVKEITVEAGRPDTINKEILTMLKAKDIDRISINPQTMNDETLKLIGRNHSSKDIIESYKLARKIGFSNINMDIILGLPGEGLKEVEYTLKNIMDLKPENLTIHTLAVKKGSKFKKTMDHYNIEEENIIENMIELSREYAEKMGLKPYYLYRQKQMLGNYENVGYAIKDMECIYNILIMAEKESILAVGPGGVSKIFSPKENRIERVPNVKGLKEYLVRIDEMIERKRKAVDNY